MSFASYFGVVFSVVKKSRIIATSALLAALTNIILNFLLIPRLGVFGAIISTCVSYLVIAMYRILKAQQFIHVDIKWCKLLISIVLLMVQCVCVTMNFNAVIISIIILIILIVWYGKDLLSIGVLKNEKKS